MKQFIFKPVFIAVVALAPLSAMAQFPMAEGPTRERAQSESERDLEERIAAMRYLATLAEKRGTPRKRDPQLALEELQEDFTRLQIVNRELVLTASKSADLDLKFVERSASEINKRAERLMSNLALPEATPDPAQTNPVAPSNSKQLKESITSLGWRIYWFVKNPIFKEAKVIDTQNAAKAQRHLEEIILRSSQIKAGSEALRQATKKSQ
jgi:hypothetical protein